MKLKKLSSILLALILVFAMTVAALADSGTITIQNSNDNTSPLGRTFKAYSILDVTLSTGDIPVYTVPDSMKSFYASYFSLDFTGKTQAWIDDAVFNKIDALNASQMEDFAEQAAAAAIAASIVPVTIGPSTTDITVYQDVSVPYGYYVIKDVTDPDDINPARVSAVMVNTTTPDITIKLKAETPDIDKAIVADDSSTSYSNVAAVGDTVNFKITGKVPDMTGYTTYWYNVVDTLSKGLTFTPGSVAVKVGTTTLAASAYDVSVNVDSVTGVTTLKVVLKDFYNSYKDQAGAAIVVTYAAVVNKDAVYGDEGNLNTATLIYSNDPNTTYNGDEPGEGDVYGESPAHKTKTFVTGIDLKKVDASGNALSGAVFELTGSTLNLVVVTEDVFTLDPAGTYYKLTDGTYTTTAPTPETTEKYDSTTDLYKKETVTTVKNSVGGTVAVSGTVDASGMLTFNGLKPGDYTLTEIVAPNGYKLLADPITFTISVTNLPTAIITGNETCTWQVTSPATRQEDGSLYIEVVNVISHELPGTGGIGTTIFTIAGLALMAGAALLLIMRRKARKATR